MTDQAWNNLKKKYPNILGKLDGAACDDGWYFLIDEACSQVEWYNKNNKTNYQFLQIKEKFGFLRCYVGINGQLSNNEYLNGVLFTLEKLSGLICETCGTNQEIGRTTRGWIKTLCLSDSLNHNRANEWNSLEVINDKFRELS